MDATRRFGLLLGMMTVWTTGCGAMAPGPTSNIAHGSGDRGPSSPATDAASTPASPPGEYSGPTGQASPPPPPSAPMGGMAPSDSPSKSARRAEADERPGLGTEWGETRTSRISTVSFERADAASPFTTASFFYNDEAGAQAMASAAGFHRTSSGTVAIANGMLSMGLRDESSRFLSGFVAGARTYVVGEAGKRYVIVLHNNSDLRLEVVLSVDGLDVLDGKAANFSKRGYLIEPRADLEVDGFRQTTETVAAFRFGSVRDSYANQKHGDARNVGVVGVALFHERGTNPFNWPGDEAKRRQNANPFPGQFATPP